MFYTEDPYGKVKGITRKGIFFTDLVLCKIFVLLKRRKLLLF